MEFEIGNILYIVITLVAVIVGLLGKKKKPGGKGTGEAQGPARPGFLENLEKAFNMGQPDQAVADLQEYEEDLPDEEWNKQVIPAAEDEPMSLLEEYELLIADRRGSQQMDSLLFEPGKQTEQMEIINLDSDEGTDYFEVVKDFDAGTAVVYSAIINRLDY